MYSNNDVIEVHERYSPMLLLGVDLYSYLCWKVSPYGDVYQISWWRHGTANASRVISSLWGNPLRCHITYANFDVFVVVTLNNRWIKKDGLKGRGIFWCVDLAHLQCCRYTGYPLNMIFVSEGCNKLICDVKDISDENKTFTKTKTNNGSFRNSFLLVLSSESRFRRIYWKESVRVWGWTGYIPWCFSTIK